MNKLTFSGHDSFPCKSTWLKRGYDFVKSNGDFNSKDSVVKLGVGKNMVSSIKYWMKSFNLLDDCGELTDIANYLFDESTGKDKYIEDISTQWLLHYLLIYKKNASIYHLAFLDYHRQVNSFEKIKFQNFIKRIYLDFNQIKSFNPNTVKKDIDVFLRNYVEPDNGKVEDYSPLLIDLNLIRKIPKDKSGSTAELFKFNYSSHHKVTENIFLYGVLSSDDSDSVSYEVLQNLGLIFCLTNSELIELIKNICKKYSDRIVFSDQAGVKELQFKNKISWKEVLDNNYK